MKNVSPACQLPTPQKADSNLCDELQNLNEKFQ